MDFFAIMLLAYSFAVIINSKVEIKDGTKNEKIIR